MEGLATAIVELFAALIQVVVGVVGALLEALGFSVGHLAEKPKEGESRFSGQRLLVAFAPFIIVALFFVGTFAFFHWRHEVRKAKTDTTRRLVSEHADRLAGQVDNNGHLVRHPAPTLDVNDAWGNALRVKYEETLTHQLVVVWSTGYDGKPDTIWDISASRKVLRPKQEIALDLFGKVKDVIKDRIRDREQPHNHDLDADG